MGKVVRHRLLEAGHSLLMVARSLPDSSNRRESWIPFESDWMDHLGHVDGIINFAGEPIAGMLWTAKRRHNIQLSRAGLCHRMMDRLGRFQSVPKVWINASAVGYYGDRGNEILTETSSQGQGFLAQVCGDWEREVTRSTALGVREVRLRLGMVMGKQGGLLGQVLPLYRAGLGATLGTGSQYFPWVHVGDVASAVEFALAHPIRGAVNVVSSQQITQLEFSQALAKTLHKTSRMRVPSWVLRLGLGSMSELLLSSQRVVPEALSKHGFKTHFTDFQEMLADELGT